MVSACRRNGVSASFFTQLYYGPRQDLIVILRPVTDRYSHAGYAPTEHQMARRPLKDSPLFSGWFKIKYSMKGFPSL